MGRYQCFGFGFYLLGQRIRIGIPDPGSRQVKIVLPGTKKGKKIHVWWAWTLKGLKKANVTCFDKKKFPIDGTVP